MYNTPQKEVDIEISKQDIATKKELPGATLEVKDKDGKVIDTWVSTGEVHTIKYIIAGTYTLTETIAPEGYELSKEVVTFTVKEDGTTETMTVKDALLKKIRGGIADITNIDSLLKGLFIKIYLSIFYQKNLMFLKNYLKN